MTTKTIAALNDYFRKTGAGGRVFATSGVVDLPEGVQAELLHAVRTFSDFNPNNDPHGEHDFGAIDLRGERYFWKIDYYETDEMMAGAENPLSCFRVLTVMRADEY